jgi:hypothetical protein
VGVECSVSVVPKLEVYTCFRVVLARVFWGGTPCKEKKKNQDETRNGSKGSNEGEKDKRTEGEKIKLSLVLLPFKKYGRQVNKLNPNAAL